MGVTAPVERQAADVIAADVARYGHGDTRQRKGMPPPLPMGCLGLTGSVVLVTIIGLLVGFFIFGQPITPLATAGPSPTATLPPTPAPSPTPSPPPPPTLSPRPSPSASLTPSPSAAGPQGEIGAYCVRVEHSELGEFLSYLEWFLLWLGDSPEYFELIVRGANDGDPVTLEFDPGRGTWYGRLGLRGTGTKQIVSLVAHWPDGSTTDLTGEMIEAFGGDEIEVRYPQEDSYGDCPAG